MAAAVASIAVTEVQVRQFLDSLLGRPLTTADAPAAAPQAGPAAGAAVSGGHGAGTETAPASQHAPAATSPWLFGPAGAATPGGSSSLPPVRLHPRVDAVHPLGEAHSSGELEDAIKLYRQLVKDVRLEVDDILMGSDKAIVTAHQTVTSHVAGLTHQLPFGALPHQLQHMTSEFLPSFKEARIPTTIQLRFGKSDAGDPVVTQLAVTFSLLAVLLPHLALQPWQQQILQQTQQPLLHALVSAGSLAATLEDVGTSLSATWRATAAVLQATLGTLVSEVRERLQATAAAGVERAGSGDINGAHP